MEACCFATVPDAKWDAIAESLRNNCGVATVDLPPDIATSHSNSFATARRGLDVAVRHAAQEGSIIIKTIGSDEDSAHATGYHCAGSDGSSMSRYNFYREGFVFSDGELFDVDLRADVLTGEQHPHDSCTSFRDDMESMFSSMHDAIASNVLRAVARNMGCQDEDWFQNHLGPTDKSSQWHIKRYVRPTDGDASDASQRARKECMVCHKGAEGEDDELEWLPVHTDPSLLSVVLHDVPGKRVGAMGLQYQVPDPSALSGPENDSHQANRRRKIWKDVPWHGHAVATVFVGSVLSYISGNLFPAAKHRVVYRPSTEGENERVAATLFVRPRGDCMLQVPPSPLLTAEGGRVVKIRNTTFNAWLARVSRNYMKGRRKEHESNESSSRV